MTDPGSARVLWASDNVVLNSAYANQSRAALVWLNHDDFGELTVDHSPLVGLEHAMYEPGDPWPFRVWPAEGADVGQQFGGDDVLDAFYRGDYDLLVAFKDALSWLPRFHKNPAPTVLYTPVASDPAPDPLFEAAERATAVWAPSKNGVEQFDDNGIEATYVPHFVDGEAFRPVRENDPVTRDELRAGGSSGATTPLRPDDFVVGFVGINRGERKDLGRIIEGFAEWRDGYDHEVEARLHLHTNPEPEGSGGIAVRELMAKLGLPERAVVITDPWKRKVGYTTSAMARWYNTLDCYLGTTRGEGFGVPLLEAAACGVPVVATDHAAMPERVVEGENGYLVEPVELESNYMTGTNAIPAVDDIAEAIELVYQSEWDPEAVRATVMPGYDVETVVGGHFYPALREALGSVYETVEVAG